MMVMKPFFVLRCRPPYSFNHNDYRKTAKQMGRTHRFAPTKL